MLDMNFTLGVNNGNEGLFWLRTIRKQHPQTPVVLLTAYADVNLAVKGLKNGAADFITKPWDNDELVHKLKDVLDMQNEIVSLDEMEKNRQPRRDGEGTYPSHHRPLSWQSHAGCRTAGHHQTDAL